MIGSCVSRVEVLIEGNWELRENRWYFVVGNKVYLFSFIYIFFVFFFFCLVDLYFE